MPILLAGLLGCVAAAAQEGGDGLRWVDAHTLTVEGQGWSDIGSPWARLPARAQERVRPPVWSLGSHSAGIAVRFRSDAPQIHVRWTLLYPDRAMDHMPATGVSGVDLYARAEDGSWRFLANGQPHQQSNEANLWSAPSGEYTLYLPLYNGVASVEIGVAADSTLEPLLRPEGGPKPVVFYGTSIVQGGCASRPGLAATAIAGRTLDVPVINLGFSGSALMEPEIAELLAELDPSVYAIDPLWNMSPEMVAERTESFVRTVRAARPETPILLVEDSQHHNVVPTPKGVVLRERMAALEGGGVTGLHFLSAEGMLGSDGEGTVDGCHPNDIGFLRQAEAYVGALEPLLGG